MSGMHVDDSSEPFKPLLNIGTRALACDHKEDIVVYQDEGQEKTPVGLIWPYAQQGCATEQVQPIEVLGYLGSLFVQVAIVEGQDKVQRERVLDMSRTLGPQVLFGVVVVGSDELESSDFDMLVHESHVLVLASAEDSVETAKRLVRVLTLPSEPNGFWCTDWNDLYAIVTTPRPVRPARHLRASACGMDAVSVFGPSVHQELADNLVNALVLLSIGKSVRGAQIKQIHSNVQARLHPDSTIVKSTVMDASLAHDEVVLDVLVFGSPAANRIKDAGVPSVVPSPTADCATYDIPAFLRQRTP